MPSNTYAVLGTYGFDDLAWTYGGTQNQSFDLTAALNHGVRQFDVRVEYYDPGNGLPGDCRSRLGRSSALG